MGHFKEILTACNLHGKKKLIEEGRGFFISMQVTLSLSKKETT